MSTKKEKLPPKRVLTAAETELLQKYLIEPVNICACANATGVHHSTIKRMWAQKIGKVEFIKKVKKFCYNVKKSEK